MKQTYYVCSECGEEFTKWSGICSNCKQWNTLKEFKTEKGAPKSGSKKELLDVCTLSSVKCADFTRLRTDIGEFDRVLGGGIVPGSVILLGGDPGIGKSTLIAQVAANISDSLYISGEESLEQIKLRVDRIGIDSSKIKAIADTDIDAIIATIQKKEPKLVIVDSIQTMYTDAYPSTPGSLVQVRECALKLQQCAKKSHIPIVLIGHVTKEGGVAGPKILEHLVDAVMYLEGERYHNNRILRAIKNRFGAIDEIGVFEMTQKGMIEVANASKLFLEERTKNVPGSVVSATVEGNRPILVEIQALVTPSIFGFPKRTTSGFDLNRLNLLLAILTKRAKINFGKYDVYINVVGGFKIKDPGVDLAVCVAAVSAYSNKKVDPKICLFGEVGLSGEIRKVRFQEKRNKEAKRLGFSRSIVSNYIYDIMREIFK